VFASCAKSARSYCLVLKYLKFSLYLVLNEKFQYDHKVDLRKILSNTVISKLLVHVIFLVLLLFVGLHVNKPLLHNHTMLSIVDFNICWYNLRTTLILISCIASTSLGLGLMCSLSKGEQMCT
jgi:hypothetical protein